MCVRCPYCKYATTTTQHYGKADVTVCNTAQNKQNIVYNTSYSISNNAQAVKM
jgi:hypothetical protein